MNIGEDNKRTDIFAGLESLVFFAWQDLEGVGTKVVTLSLEEVGRDNLAPVTVEEGQCSAEGGCGDTPEDGLCDDTSPAGLSLVDGFIGEQTCQMIKLHA
jgi:hypothetical protein